METLCLKQAPIPKAGFSARIFGTRRYEIFRRESSALARQLGYNDLIATIPEPPKGMDSTEWTARVELAAAYRLTHFYGWTSVVYNHITLRVPDTDTFLINAFGLRYDEITASNLVLIDLDGNKVDPENKWPVNKAGYLIHSAIHKARPDDLHCVMHTHELYSQTMSALNVESFRWCRACQLFERVGYHDFEGIVLDESEQERLVAAIGTQHHTLVLKNHGLLTGAQRGMGICAPSAFYPQCRDSVAGDSNRR